jgi:hypothetical protein
VSEAAGRSAEVTTSERRRRRRGRDSESCVAISHIYKDCVQSGPRKGSTEPDLSLTSLEVRFVRGVAGTTRILTIRAWSQKSVAKMVVGEACPHSQGDKG